MTLLSPDEVAARASTTMHAADSAAQFVGLQVQEVRRGFAKLALTVRPEMLNGHQICHGGYMFILADTALAHASNSYNQVAVAATASIEFLRPVHLDDTLTGIAEEQVLQGRNGIYDVRVTNQRDELVALFRGKTRLIRGKIVEELEITTDS
jgi:acyl-CoA thioesterase